ncbi:acyltransferase [Duganella caerulea]|uniref:acyltransferase family protein n=1 Tax=Duganella caerulea TaxID=2885762 RepID=UPI0030E9839D
MSLFPRPRFDILDGLRGIAAIAVMFYHYTQHNGLRWLPGAWVAVDLFFILSGFVIAHSYGAKLLKGMHFKQFLLIRLVRLGPLYYFGLFLGIFSALLSLYAHPDSKSSIEQIATMAALNMAWLPYFSELPWPLAAQVGKEPVFPLNDPAWSLFFEAFVNIVFFVFVYKYHKVFSIKLIIPAAAVFVMSTIIMKHGNQGWGAHNFILGFPRVLAEFFAGVGIYQYSLQRKAPPATLVWVTIAAAMLCLFIDNDKVAFVNSITLLPLTVFLAATLTAQGKLKALCTFLGHLSYPLYVIHMPVERLLLQLPQVRLLDPAGQTFTIAAVSIFCAVLLIGIDEQLRNYLTARWLKTSSDVKTAASPVAS